MNYWTVPLILAIYGVIVMLTALAQAINGALLVRARHARRQARHVAKPQDPYRNDYLIRRPSRFPAPAKGWDKR